MTKLAPDAYVVQPETWRYFRHNLTTRPSFFLPGVFDDNIYPQAVNGSIWSLRYEVRAYVVLLLLGFLALLRPRLPGVLAWSAAVACLWLAAGRVGDCRSRTTCR